MAGTHIKPISRWGSGKSSRKVHAAARAAEEGCTVEELFSRLAAEVGRCRDYLGRRTKWFGIDWALKPSNCAKLLDGNYRDDRYGPSQPDLFGSPSAPVNGHNGHAKPLAPFWLQDGRGQKHDLSALSAESRRVIDEYRRCTDADLLVDTAKDLLREQSEGELHA